MCMKYLVHTLGFEKFTKLLEIYQGVEIQLRAMVDWKYNDWMGWWEQGDGKFLFYGQHTDNGNVKDEGDFRLKPALRVLVDKSEVQCSF